MDIYIGIFLVGMIILYAFTLSYRKALREKVDKSEHKLWIMYGLAMFLVDNPLKRIVAKNNKALEESFKSLYVKEKVREEKYLYVVSKVALVLVVMFVTGIISMLVSTSSEIENREITYINRNKFYEGETIYNLQVDTGKEEKNIEISVPAREYTDEELRSVMEGYRDELLDNLLGENESPDKITKDINLVSTIGWEGIPVIWEIDNEKVINTDGTLNENVDNSETMVKVKAILSIKNISVVHDFSLNICPEVKTDLQHQIQKVVDEYDSTKEKIILPDKVENKKIKFFIKDDNMGGHFFLLGILAAISIFILKDKDLDKQIAKRNQQMLLDYSEIVSKIMLLSKAGMTIRKAWEQTIITSGLKKEHYVYREMKMTLGKINSGITESLAYEQFGKRCGLHCYIRFANLLSQNLKIGKNDLCKVLENEMSNALMERKNSALKQGEEAGTKMLGPMVVMLILGLSFIVIPAFMSVDI